MNRLICIRDLFFSYDNTPLLEGISLHVSMGETVAISGSSGSGKTTLFKLMAGLLTPLQGVVDRRAKISYLMQQDLLLDWRTVLDNILLAQELGGGGRLEALELMNLVGLKGMEQRYPLELSGGMRQRVSLARSLLFNRPLLLLDEPFASVDKARRLELYQLIRARKDRGVVLITHDVEEAAPFANRIYSVERGRCV